MILVDQSTVVYADTLDQAIQQLVGAAPPTTPTGPPLTTLTPAQLAQLQSLVAQANDHYKAAYAALARSDFATYGAEMQIVGQLLQQIQALTGSASTGPSPSPSPKASASP